jgi:hypothetical protein
VATGKFIPLGYGEILSDSETYGQLYSAKKLYDESIVKRNAVAMTTL